MLRRLPATMPTMDTGNAPNLRVMALHALLYCERLFFLEEVEELRVADDRVLAGRSLHLDLDEPAEVVEFTLESSALGLRGRVDALRRRDGSTYPVEHKRGRSMKVPGGEPRAWPSDEVQAVAYALLLEEHLGVPVPEARIRYHRDNTTVRVQVTPERREAVRWAVERGRALAATAARPAVTTDERKCVRCSLAPVCLPEEARLAAAERAADEHDGGTEQAPSPLRLYPADTERKSLHVTTQGARVGRSGEGFVVHEREQGTGDVGAREVSDIVLHGFAQISTQALRLCADEGIPVHVCTTSGALVGTFSGPSGGVQRRIRQYRALADDAVAVRLAVQLIRGKLDMQLRHVLRGTRQDPEARAAVEGPLQSMRQAIKGAAHAQDRDTLMGHEGAGAKAYFAALATRVVPEAGEGMVPRGRSRRPPRDRFNALLGFGYALLEKDIMSAVLRVGLEPALGMLHQPRSAAWPLVLDLMELFRVPVVDVAVLGAVNRRTFDPEADFKVTGPQVWLSETGRRKAIELYERRKAEEYRHDVLGYSLTWARMMELEVRLLEKEWSGEPGLFARFRIR